MESGSNQITLFINGKKLTIVNPDPEWTLLYYLRYKLGLCGTKEGCGEGGCGACTVLLSKYNRKTKSIQNLAVTACLVPLCTLHGTAVVTVEGIGSSRSGLHPVQERIAKSHGTQCGFCTPGFVMSMYALLRNNPVPTTEELEEAFQGNLCRCTGYRPIISGFRTFCCKDGGNGTNGGCCMETKKKTEEINGDIQVASTLFDASEFKPYDPSQDVVFPPELIVDSSYEKARLSFSNSTVSFHRTTDWEDLLRLKALFPTAKIIGGNTELGLEAKFKQQIPSVYIFPTNILELVQIHEGEAGIRLGGGTTLSQLQTYSREKEKEKGSVLEAIYEMLHWFAGPQIRNVGTIAGNIVTASPISDLNPIWMATGSTATLESINGTREILMDSSFFNGYRTTAIQPQEILKTISVPTTKENEYVWACKQCRRREDDIAIVNCCMRIEFDEKDPLLITSCSMAFGGMGPTTVFASKTSKYLTNKKWSFSLLENVSRLLALDFHLGWDAPGGMPAYRQSLTLSFFYKFFLVVSDWMNQKGVEESPIIDSRLRSGMRACARTEEQDSQLFQIVGKEQPLHDLVGRPIPHSSSLKHATGEAVYIDDTPLQTNELFGALVLNRTVPYGRIVSVDASIALQMEGVVDYIDANSIPPGGSNAFGSIEKDETVFPTDTVNYIGQTVGILIAKNQATAEKAAKLVKVKVEPLSPTILTTEDAVAHESFQFHRSIFKGDVTSSFESSEHVIEGQMRVGGQEQFYLETQSCIAIPKEDDELEILLGTQGPASMQRQIASVLGIRQNRVTVKTRRVGGSFGGKETRSALVGIPAAIAAHKLRVPIRCVLNRYDDMEATGHRNSYLFKYKVGFGSDGLVHGIRLHFWTNSGWSHDLCSAIIEVTILSIDGAHSIPNWEVKGWACKTNMPPNTAMRGFGVPEGSVLLHTIFEMVAAKLGKDSLDIRKLHLYSDGDYTLGNKKLTECRVQKCLQECLLNAKYEEKRIEVEEFNRKNLWKKRGIGVTTTKHNCGFEPRFFSQAGAIVMVHLDGSVSLNHGGMEMGQGLHTKMIQIATRVLGIPACKIYFSETATDKVPNATATCGSVSSDLNGMAVVDACQQLVKRLEPYKEANPSGAWEDWVAAAYYDQTNLSAVGFYKNKETDWDWKTSTGKYCHYLSYGAAFSLVEIDCLTGDHSLLSTWIVMDVGESLNPAVDVGQIEGAFVQGYGLFVLEELLHSPKGNLLTKGPSTYKIPGLNDIPPEFHVALLRGSSNPHAVYSSKAIGEPPFTLSTSVFFAIRNAIADARKERHLPLDFELDSPATAERIRLACQNEFSVSNQEPVNGKLPWAIIV